MKGIILAGGSGSRLYPMTSAINKHLLPIYNKPMVYYPLCTLMLADIKEILIISTPEDIGNFKNLLGDGDRFGLSLNYAVQPSPDGLAQAFIIGEEFIGSDDVAMVLGDNIFIGLEMKERLDLAIRNVKRNKASIFGFRVNDPQRFGVIEYDENGSVVSIEEKPRYPKSNYAAAGLYFYDNRVVEYANMVRPSHRNELEITDVNNLYLQEGCLEAIRLDDGFMWMDAGTPDAMIEAGKYVQTLEKDRNVRVGYPEEIAINNGWINRQDLDEFFAKYAHSDYGKYITKVLEIKEGKV
ncbi:MAG TPA: glucose-1-phosphate thymidylyltransferase RfbA [Methanomassiliicoccales archaeon]|jgi:glucose-1-phosphate thymidylyltransferase